jgi:hypothetical protein
MVTAHLESKRLEVLKDADTDQRNEPHCHRRGARRQGTHVREQLPASVKQFLKGHDHAKRKLGKSNLEVSAIG